MKTRRLSITPDLLVSMFSMNKPKGFTLGKNKLPEDAWVVEVEIDKASDMIHLWIQSSVFNDSDPDDLPPVEMFEYTHLTAKEPSSQ